LASSLWLVVDASWTLTRSDTTAEPAQDATFTVTSSKELSTSGSVGAGVRWVLIDALVEPSLYALGGASFDYSRGDDTTETDDGTKVTDGTIESLGYGYGVGVVAGVALEMPVYQALSVRLASDVVGASWATGNVERRKDQGDIQHFSASRVGAGLDLRPSLQVRLGF
jgi:hypothetical protein